MTPDPITRLIGCRAGPSSSRPPPQQLTETGTRQRRLTHVRHERLLELRQLAGRRGHDLKTDAAHLVGRLLTPRDADGRLARVPLVRGGVVVADFRVEARPLRQRDKLRKAVSLLP